MWCRTQCVFFPCEILLDVNAVFQDAVFCKVLWVWPRHKWSGRLCLPVRWGNRVRCWVFGSQRMFPFSNNNNSDMERVVLFLRKWVLQKYKTIQYQTIYRVYVYFPRLPYLHQKVGKTHRTVNRYSAHHWSYPLVDMLLQHRIHCTAPVSQASVRRPLCLRNQAVRVCGSSEVGGQRKLSTCLIRLIKFYHFLWNVCKNL